MSAGTQTKYYLDVDGNHFGRVNEDQYKWLKCQYNVLIVVIAREVDNYPISKTACLLTRPETDEIANEYVQRLTDAHPDKPVKMTGRTIFQRVPTTKTKEFDDWDE